MTPRLRFPTPMAILLVAACRSAPPQPSTLDTTDDTAVESTTGDTSGDDTGLPMCEPVVEPCQSHDVASPAVGQAVELAPNTDRSTCATEIDVLQACDAWIPEFDGCPPEDWVGYDADEWREVTTFAGDLALNRKGRAFSDPDNPGHTLVIKLYYVADQPIYIAIDRIEDPEHRWWCCGDVRTSELGYGDFEGAYAACRIPPT